jgi:hypothetical protein
MVAIGLFNTKKRCMYGLVNVRAESYQTIMLINLQWSALVLFLFLLQSTIPEINIVFLLYVLQFILIIGDVETHLGPGTYNSNPPVNITNNNVDEYISICKYRLIHTMVSTYIYLICTLCYNMHICSKWIHRYVCSNNIDM